MLCMNSYLFFFFQWFGVHRYLHLLTHSVPTLRSSALSRCCSSTSCAGCAGRDSAPRRSVATASSEGEPPAGAPAFVLPRQRRADDPGIVQELRGHDRSEEHTSELQSLMRISYHVFCLKNKKTSNRNNMYDTS